VVINGKLIKLGVMKFNIDFHHLSKDFEIQSLATHPTKSLGVIKATFHPDEYITTSSDFWVISSELALLYGEFDVTVLTLTDTHQFKAKGVVKVHKCRW
jgi:hypothetical protein